MPKRRLKAVLLLLVVGCAAPLILGVSGSSPEPELDDHGMPIAGGADWASGAENHEEVPPPFTFFVRGIEPDFTDVVLKAMLAPVDEEALSFPSEFSVRWITPSGRAVQIPLTPVKEKNVLAAKIHGPLERGIHSIQATLVMRGEDGFVARVAEQHAELDSQTLRLQLGPLKLFPDEEFLHHEGEEDASAGFSIGVIQPYIGPGIFLLFIVCLVFFLRKRGVKIGPALEKMGPVFEKLKTGLRPLMAKLDPVVRPLLVKLNEIAPKRLRRVIPSGGAEERLNRDEIVTEGQGSTDISASATDVIDSDQKAGGSNSDSIEDQPTAIATGSEAPEQAAEQADPPVPEAKAAPEAPSNETESEPSGEDGAQSGSGEGKDEAGEDLAAEEVVEEEVAEAPTDVEPSVEEPESESAMAEAEEEKAGEEADREEIAKEPAEAKQSSEISEPEPETAEAETETELSESAEAPEEEKAEADSEPEKVSAEADSEPEKAGGETDSEPAEAKAEAVAEIEIPSEVDPEQQPTGTVEALGEIIDEAEAPEASEKGSASGEVEEPVAELEIEGLSDPAPSPPKDSE